MVQRTRNRPSAIAAVRTVPVLDYEISASRVLEYMQSRTKEELRKDDRYQQAKQQRVSYLEDAKEWNTMALLGSVGASVALGLTTLIEFAAAESYRVPVAELVKLGSLSISNTGAVTLGLTVGCVIGAAWSLYSRYRDKKEINTLQNSG